MPPIPNRRKPAPQPIILDPQTYALECAGPPGTLLAHLIARAGELGVKKARASLPIGPGYLFDAYGLVHQCARFRLHMIDVGITSDGGTAAADPPAGWSPEAVADVLGVAIHRRVTRGDLLSDLTRETRIRRVVAEGEVFEAMFIHGGSFWSTGVDASIQDGVLMFQRARRAFENLGRPPDSHAATTSDLTDLLQRELCEWLPISVHPGIARLVARHLRDHPPSAETLYNTHPPRGVFILDGATDRRWAWRRELRRHLRPAAWPEVGAVALPERPWLARNYPRRVESALDRWRARPPDGPLTPDLRAELADLLSIWSPARTLTPGESRKDRRAHLTWASAHLDELPLLILTDLVAEALVSGAVTTVSLEVAFAALARAWHAVKRADFTGLETSLVRRVVEPPDALQASACGADSYVRALRLFDDGFEYRLGVAARHDSRWSVPLPPDVGALIARWFDGSEPWPEGTAAELVALALVDRAGDPTLPFVVMSLPDRTIEACWWRGSMRFRIAGGYHPWTRHLEDVLPRNLITETPPRFDMSIALHLGAWLERQLADSPVSSQSTAALWKKAVQVGELYRPDRRDLTFYREPIVELDDELLDETELW